MTSIILTSIALALGTQTPNDRAADLDVFESDFLQAEASYSPDARKDAEALLAALRSDADRLSAAEFELALARITALAENGHSGVFAGYWPVRFNRMGIMLVHPSDGIIIGAAMPDEVAHVGKRVTAIGGRSIAEIEAIWDQYSGQVPGLAEESILYFLESPAMLHAAGIGDDADRARFDFADGSSAIFEARRGWIAATGIANLAPRELRLAEAGLINAGPLYLQQPQQLMMVRPLPEQDAIYIRFLANSDPQGKLDLAKESKALAKRLAKDKPRFVIVDERFNGGGDLNNTRSLMQAIPKAIAPGGHIYAITSGKTFSAAISSVGYLKQAAGDGLTIIGEPVGDKLEFWAEGSPLILPGAGTVIGRARERHNYRTGCQEADCHDSIRKNPIAVDTLAPDVSPAITYADLIAGRDPYMDAVREDMARRAR